MRGIVVYISLLLLCVGQVSAQVILPVGGDQLNTIIQSCDYNDAVHVLSVNDNDHYEISYWNGDFWNKLPEATVLPSITQTSGGQFRIVDMISYDGNIIIAAEYGLDLLPGVRNYIVQWDGTAWTDISNDDIKYSIALNKLLVLDSDLLILGQFNTQTGITNTLKYAGNSSWTQGGQALVNENTERFNDAVVVGDQLVVSGKFNVSSSTSTRNMAIWDGSDWKFANLPPFLNESNTLGYVNGSLIASGTNLDGSFGVKLQTGSEWKDLSAGMNDFEISEIKSFESLGSEIYANGKFVESSSKNESDILVWTDNTWKPTQIRVKTDDYSELISSNDDLFVTGLAPLSNGPSSLNHIGKIVQGVATVIGQTFEDLNANCVKDGNEKYLSGIKMNISGTDQVVYSDEEGYFIVQTKPGKQYDINIEAPNYWQTTCTDETVFTQNAQDYHLGDFGVRALAGSADLSVKLINPKGYRLSENTINYVYIVVENFGTETIEGATLELNHGLSYTQFVSDLPMDNYTLGTANWTISSIEPNTAVWIKCAVLPANDVDLSLDVMLDLPKEWFDRDESNNEDLLALSIGETGDIAKYDLNNGQLFRESESAKYRISVTNFTDDNIESAIVVDELDDQFFISKKGISYLTLINNQLDIEYTYRPEIKNYQYKFIWRFEHLNLPPDSTFTIDLNLNIAPGFLEKGDFVCNQAKVYLARKSNIYGEYILTDNVCSLVEEGLGSQIFVQDLEKELVLYPNPTTGELHFEQIGINQKTFEIVDVLGRVLLTGEILNKQIDLSQLNTGHYYLNVEGFLPHRITILK